MTAVVLKVRLWGAIDPPQIDFGAGMTRLMTEHGFVVRHLDADSHFPLIQAQAGACDVVVGAMSPLGWHRYALKRIAPPGSDVFVMYQGVRYEDQPEWLTKLHHYWTRLNRVVGRFLLLPPILGVVAGPGCGPAQTSWLNALDLT